MISEIIGKRFNCISNASDMLCLFLGEDHSFTNESNDVIDVAEFSLHVQSKWCFKKGSDILFSSEDIRKLFPNQTLALSNVRFKKLLSEIQESFVTDYTLSENNGLNIVFSSGILFEQFPSFYGKSEEWRMIDYKNDIHTVAFKDKIGQE